MSTSANCEYQYTPVHGSSALKRLDKFGGGGTTRAPIVQRRQFADWEVEVARDVSPAEQRLARAILVQALADYTDDRFPANPHTKAGRSKLRRMHEARQSAEEFLFGTDTRDAARWCALADVPLSDIRAHAHDTPHNAFLKAYNALMRSDGGAE